MKKIGVNNAFLMLYFLFNEKYKMNQVVLDEAKKQEILTFLTPDNLASDVCVAVYDELKKRSVNLGDLENNYFTCFSKEKKLCHILVDVDPEYNIVIKFNSNVYGIKTLENVQDFVKIFLPYTGNLKKLYKHVKSNYGINNENDLTNMSCGNLRFDCDDNEYYVLENGNKTSFKTLDEMDQCELVTVTKYKMNCKLLNCIC